jgi:hypothetical protein
MGKKILYIDMDNVLVDFKSGIACLDESGQKQYAGHLDDVPGIFAYMEPIKGAVESFEELSRLYDTYVLSTAPWDNPSAWADKVRWIQRYLGESGYKRLILSHHKNLCKGDYLVDDRSKNGAGDFDGELILFASTLFPDWAAVREYLRYWA